MRLSNEQMKTARVKCKPVPRKSRRNENLTCPAARPVLTWNEEQKIYDRMYEAEVWKNGRFFGYRSEVATQWHDSEQAREEAAKPLNRELAAHVFVHQSEKVSVLTDGELKREHRCCLSNHLFKEEYGEDK